jgi:hypothetical protein
MLVDSLAEKKAGLAVRAGRANTGAADFAFFLLI